MGQSTHGVVIGPLVVFDWCTKPSCTVVSPKRGHKTDLNIDERKVIDGCGVESAVTTECPF